MALAEYRRKRHFGVTSEPRGKVAAQKHNSFVIQRHDASRLHYDFRLEIDGVLKSWAVPKGPSLDPSVKRLAVHVEDHPLEYGSFEGNIPEGQYGAGEVILWDRGTFEPEGSLSASEQLARGELKFVLHGQKLNGSFVLVRLKNRPGGKDWLLIKHRDQYADPNWQIEEHAESVKSGRQPQGNPRRRRAKAVQPAEIVGLLRQLPGVRQRAVPHHLKPALASLAEKPFSSPDWLYEIKWDGERTLAWIENGKTLLRSRSDREITHEFPEFAGLARHVRVPQVLLDGEVVVLDNDGRSDFQRLQSRFGVQNPSADLQHQAPVTYYLFDVLHCEGFDLTRVPLLERRKVLAKVVTADDRVRISDYQMEKGEELFAAAEKAGLEGIIAKRAESVYPEGRTRDWLKFKTTAEVDAVVGGWTDPRGSRQYFGSLLVGLYRGDKLQFITGVGTGFTNELEAKIFAQLRHLHTEKCPFTPQPSTREPAHWVKPALVARVGYGGWTSDDHLRQPRFMGLQPDRNPKDCTFAKEQSGPIATEEPKLGRYAKRKDRTKHAGDGEADLEEEIKSVGPASLRKREAEKRRKSAPPKHTGRRAGDEAALADELNHGKSEEARFELGGKELKLTHLNKVLFPDSGFTKRHLLAYYYDLSEPLLPFLKDRPLVLNRFPNGIDKPSFYQKEAGLGVPDWMQTVSIDSDVRGKKIDYFIANDAASLLYLTNLGCIEENPFSSRLDSLEQPDYMFMDLDPTEGTPFGRVMQGARVLLKVFDQAKLRVFMKTSGATGLHLFIPLERKYSFAQVRQFLEIIVQVASQEDSSLFTRITRVSARPKNSIFADVRQNSYGQSLASVYSIRPRPGAPASTPIAPSELRPSLAPERWNIVTVRKHKAERVKLWRDFWSSPQTIESALERLSGSAHPAVSSRKNS